MDTDRLLNMTHRLLPMSEAAVVVLIGTGVGGICGGVNLKARMGMDNFVIIEKTSSGFGGTWRHQSYPGLACDIPAHYYSFSFSPNPNWTSEFPSKREIQPYIESVCSKYQLGPHVSFDTEIEKCVFNVPEDCWDVHVNVLESTRGEAGHWKGGKAEQGRKVVRSGVLKANMIMNTSGVFTKPYTPEYPGQDKFKGTYMHACEWDSSISLSNKRVAIVGSGPTALQIVPEIAHLTAQLDIYQRTPNWIQPFNNHPFTEAQKETWRKDPKALRDKRQATINAAEGIWAAIEVPGSQAAKRVENMCTEYMKKTVKDQSLWPYLTPSYPMGCKRICVDPGYLACLNRPNVSLVCDKIQAFTENGIVTYGKQAGGRTERGYDIIVYATGWGSFSLGAGEFPTIGKNGKDIWQSWREIGIPRSFQGVLMTQFPNFLLCVGPQGNVWSSFYEMSEQVSDFMVRLLGHMVRDDISSFEVKESAERNWADFCKANIGATPYRGACISYYKFSWDHVEDAGKQDEAYADGTYENPAWFPGTPMELRACREAIKLEDLIMKPNKGRSWKAYASKLTPMANFGILDKKEGVSAFRIAATKGRRGQPPAPFKGLEQRVWSRL